MVTVCWAFMLLSGLAQAALNITASGFACRAVYCRSSCSRRIVYVPRDHNEEIGRNNVNEMDVEMAVVGR